MSLFILHFGSFDRLGYCQSEVLIVHIAIFKVRCDILLFEGLVLFFVNDILFFVNCILLFFIVFLDLFGSLLLNIHVFSGLVFIPV